MFVAALTNRNLTISALVCLLIAFGKSHDLEYVDYIWMFVDELTNTLQRDPACRYCGDASTLHYRVKYGLR